MKLTVAFILLFILSCNPNQPESTKQVSAVAPPKSQLTKAEQDSLIEKYVTTNPHGVYSAKRQQYIDEGLEQDSTIGRLWQQKAMPLYKQRKYEAGRPFLDKAAKFTPEKFLDYRAFMLCIFSKEYRDAIAGFEDCISKYGNNIVMDHSYKVYIGMSHLQLNEFEAAEKILQSDIDAQVAERGEKWVHYLDWFYLGIAKYELQKYDEAIKYFDLSMSDYAQFAEGLYYKGLCHARSGDKESANKLIEEALKQGKAGYTINEDNSIYEWYPYQMRWKLY